MAENRFISLSYDLFIKGDDGEPSLYERAPKEKPFQFISGVGYTLDLFEKNVINLKPKDSFEFEIPCSEAYGEYDEGSVLELQKSIFTRDGKFDSEHVREGYIIPLSDGEQTFNAIVQQIREDVVVVDLNHPLAGEDLRFKGQVIENRPATEKEIESILNPKGCQGHCGNCKEGCSSEKCDKEGGDCECGCKQS